MQRPGNASSVWSFEFTGFMVLSVLLCLGGAAILPQMPNIMRARGASPHLMTAAFVALLVGRLLSTLLAGRLMLRVRPQSVLMAGLGLEITTLVALAFSRDPLLLACLRFAEGVFEGVVSVVLQLLVIALSAPQDRGVKMGYMQSAFGAGFALGPMVGGFAAEYGGIRSVFLITALLFVAAAIWLATLSPKLGNVTQPVPSPHWINTSFLGYLPDYGGAILQRVCLVALSIVLPLAAVDQLGLRPHQVGWFFTASAVTTTLLMPFAARGATDASSQVRVLVGVAAMATGFFGMAAARVTPWFALAFALETLGFTLMVPNAMKLFGDRVASHPSRAEIIGTCSSARELVNIVAGFAFLPLYVASDSAPWLILAGLSGLTALPYLVARRAGSAATHATTVQP